MRFHGLDLNLLVVLDALLATRSVCEAADRICLSQSATSSALGRLREYFGDELLVVKGRQMCLTPRGEGLREPVRRVLAQIQSTVETAPLFDPSTCERSLRIVASDYALEVFLTPALRQIAHSAPRMRFEIEHIIDDPAAIFERNEADLLVTLDCVLSPEHPSRLLFEDDYVVVGWAGNPALRNGMTLELLTTLDHVAVQIGSRQRRGVEEQMLRRLAILRRRSIVVPSFTEVANLVVGTNRIAFMLRRLALRAAERLPLQIMPVPVATPGIREHVQWDKSSSDDAALRWTVDSLLAFACTQAAPADLHPEPPPARGGSLQVVSTNPSQRNVRSGAGR